MHINARTRRRVLATTALLVVSVVTCVLEACSSDNSGNKITLILGGYTTPREAYGKAIIPAFQKYWREKTGQEVEFQESYQGSGAQSRAVIAGFEADVAALSLEGDIERIAQSGLMTHDWRANQNRGIVSTSVVVIAVRPGNPKGI